MRLIKKTANFSAERILLCKPSTRNETVIFLRFSSRDSNGTKETEQV